MARLLAVLAATFISLTLATAGQAAEFYVAPGGNDANAGTIEKPFATLAKARDALRAARAKSPEAATVYLREGKYYLAEPLVLGPEDSGTNEAPIVYAAYQNEMPVISGARRLAPKWRP